MIKKFILPISITFFLFGCQLFHQSALEISGYSPSSRLIVPIDSITEISIDFSEDVNKQLIEKSFSLSGLGQDVEGSFSWPTKSKLIFQPYQSLSDGILYEIKITTEAEDKYGNNLEYEFRHIFSSSIDETRPSVDSISPVSDSIIDDLWAPIIVIFDEPVKPDSFQNSVSVPSSLNGNWTWDILNQEYTFTLLEPLEFQKEYVITIDKTLQDAAGNNLGESWESRFFVGTDQVSPTLVNFHDNNGNSVDVNLTNSIDSDWECESEIIIEFDEEIDSEKFELGFSMEPAWDYDFEITGNSVRLYSEDRLKWDTLYFIEFDNKMTDLSNNPLDQNYSFYIRTDGESSSPPTVIEAELFFPDSTSVIIYDSTYDPFQAINMSQFDTVQDTYIDILFDIASGSDFDYLHFLENLSISDSNSSLNSEIVYHMETSMVGDDLRVRVYITIENNDSNVGFVTLKLFSALTDNQNNTIEEEWICQFWAANN